MKLYKCFIYAIVFVVAFSLQGCHKDEGNGNQDSGENDGPPQSTLSVSVNGVDFNMKYVEGDTFIMGGQNYNSHAYSYDANAQEWEMPLHYVELSGFYIAETEVTQALWKAVMGDNPSCFIGDDLPVENVDWNVCHQFLDSLRVLTGRYFTLPTEAQWEYAARGGKLGHGHDYKYSGSNNIDAVAWYDSNSDSTHTVATKRPNELGLYDMSGNVMEFCGDYFGTYHDYQQENPIGPATGTRRVIRGGSWGNAPTVSRVSCRNFCSEDTKNNNLGLRLVTRR